MLREGGHNCHRFLQSAVGDVRVAAGHDDARVPEQHLYRSKVNLARRERRRERVPEDVPRDALHVRPLAEFVELPQRARGRRERTVGVREEVLAAARKRGDRRDDVRRERDVADPSVLRGSEHTARDAALDADTRGVALEHEVLPAKGGSLAEAATRVREKRDERAPVAERGCGDETLHLLLGEESVAGHGRGDHRRRGQDIEQVPPHCRREARS